MYLCVHRDCRTDTQSEWFVRHGTSCSCSCEPGREACHSGPWRWRPSLRVREASQAVDIKSIQRIEKRAKWHCAGNLAASGTESQTKSEGIYVKRSFYPLRMGRLLDCSEGGTFSIPASSVYSRCSGVYHTPFFIATSNRTWPVIIVPCTVGITHATPNHPT